MAIPPDTWQPKEVVVDTSLGTFHCELYWELYSKSPVDPMDTACENCEFMFDVTYTYDSVASSDDGTCALKLPTGPGEGCGVVQRGRLALG